MASYKAPKERVHRGFLYLDDETVINSLSAVESGKIDEVVAKVNTAREGGFGGGVGIQGAKVEGAKKSSAGFEEEMVRTRTRFSVFEIWYRTLIERDALGRFEGWDQDVLRDVLSGDTVEFRATLALTPLQTLIRTYMWFVSQAQTPGTLFAQKGEELKATNASAKVIRTMLGGTDQPDQVVLLATPVGESGPPVAMTVRLEWLIGSLGQLGGEFTVVGQVDRLLAEGESVPSLRLVPTSPPFQLELETIENVVSNFVEPSKALGFEITASDAVIAGPCLWLTPIAIYK